MLGMDIPHLNRGHIVAVDEIGVVDPQTMLPTTCHSITTFGTGSRTV